MFVLFPNGAKAWYALTRFSKRFEGLGPRVVAKEDNLFIVFPSVHFGRSVEAQCADERCFARQGVPLNNGKIKKERLMRPFWRACIGTLNTRHKKKNVFTFFLAPVEGLGPPTLRLTAECSTD